MGPTNNVGAILIIDNDNALRMSTGMLLGAGPHYSSHARAAPKGRQSALVSEAAKNNTNKWRRHIRQSRRSCGP